MLVGATGTVQLGHGAPPAEVVNSSFVPEYGQLFPVAWRVLWNTIGPLIAGKAAPATPGRSRSTPVEAAAAPTTRWNKFRVE